MPRKKLPTYEEMLGKYPDWVLDSTNTYGRENTAELTDISRARKKAIAGHYVQFLQDHGLVTRELCSAAPNIPDDFTVYLRDLTPKGFEHHRLSYLKWLGSLDRRPDADPSDVTLLGKGLKTLRVAGGEIDD
jgi:hypothetical protein